MEPNETESELDGIIHHVFLPPKLPIVDDSSAEAPPAGKNALFNTVLTAFEEFARQFDANPGIPKGIQAAEKMLTSSRQLRDRNTYGLTIEGLDRGVANMVLGDKLMLHLESSNVGVFLSRMDTGYEFSFFELSAQNSAVVGTVGRLVRLFPGTSVAVPEKIVKDQGFRQQLFSMLVQLDTHAPSMIVSKSRKGGETFGEIRNTNSPILATELLAGILRGVGESQFNQVTRIQKNTRDDIIYGKGKLLPWRRSPLYLLIKVTIQLCLHDCELQYPDKYYKFFVAFLTSFILRKSLQNPQHFSCDIISIMSKKVARKVWKLGRLGVCSEAVITAALEATGASLTRLKQVKAEVESEKTCEPWNPSVARFSNEGDLTLPNIRQRIEAFDPSNLSPIESMLYKPNTEARINQSDTTLPFFAVRESNIVLWLADIELWVREHLEAWCQLNTNNLEAASLRIVKLMETYYARATKTYRKKPEDLSYMFLTLFSLWVGLDGLVVARTPLIGSYPLGFSGEIFDQLLLPKMCHLEQLSKIREYFKHRESREKADLPHIFEPRISRQSFGTKHFENCSEMRVVQGRILSHAASKKEEKRREYLRKRKEYDEYIAKGRKHPCCDYYTDRWGIRRHSGSCDKCRYEELAASVKLVPYEWPLPHDTTPLRSVVAEICLAEDIREWRDMTYALMVDMCSDKQNDKGEGAEIWHTAINYEPLSPFRLYDDSPRIRLASWTKAQMASHYSSPKHISYFTEESSCVANGSNYKLFDSKNETWTESTASRMDLTSFCTPILAPTSIYKTIAQLGLGGTKHRSNQVLAKQSVCPSHLDLGQFIAFGSLRSGHRLQLRNIARAIKGQTLDFTAPEIHTLLVQTLWQVSPSEWENNTRNGRGAMIPESHLDLLDQEFALQLLAAISTAVQALKENWRGATSLLTYAVLTARVLSVSEDLETKSQCRELLLRCRRYSYAWTREILCKLRDSESQTEMDEVRRKLVDLALVCTQCFDVDDVELVKMLENGESENGELDIGIFLECATTIHDNLPSQDKSCSYEATALLRRHLRLIDRVAKALRQISPNGLYRGLDKAIHNLWDVYEPAEADWKPFTAPNHNWLERYTRSTEGKGLQVCYDLQSGMFLVNGAPLKSLPKNYENHPSYVRIFGRRVLEVSPSTLPEMRFTSRFDINGHAVHFRLDGDELLLRSTKCGRTYEYLVESDLGTDFPWLFKDEYAHWICFNNETREVTVEWRSKADPWASVPEWELKKVSSGEWRLTNKTGDKILLDPHGGVTQRIARTLAPIEQLENIHVFANPSNFLQVTISLPRYNLDFFINAEFDIECRQFRNMILDNERSIGTFLGLQNFLTFRPKGLFGFRRIVIPHGVIRFSSGKRQTVVEIDVCRSNSQFGCKVPYHVYEIDTDLGRLEGNGSLNSHLFKCYIHALTSFPLPDELTGKTGTEEAISLLKSPRPRSIQQRLSKSEAFLLKQISELTPKRTYYPAHLQVMEMVSWTALPSMSHHSEFQAQAQDIAENATRLGIFHGGATVVPIGGVSERLQRRASLRHSVYYSEECRVRPHEDLCEDVIYKSRDQAEDTEREMQVCEITRLSQAWEADLVVCTQFYDTLLDWEGTFSIGDTRRGLGVLGYQPELLENLIRTVQSQWCHLQKILCTVNPAEDKYRVLFYLATMAYSGGLEMEFVRSLLAFATNDCFRNTRAPPGTSFDLSDAIFKDSTILDLLEKHRKPFWDSCPTLTVSRSYGMTEGEFERKQTSQYRELYTAAFQKLLRQLKSVYPDAFTVDCPDSDLRYYLGNVDSVLEACATQLAIWNKNRLFTLYIQNLGTELRGVIPKASAVEKFSPNFKLSPKADFKKRIFDYTTLSDLFHRPPPFLEYITPKDELITTLRVKTGENGSSDYTRLDTFLQSLLGRSVSPHEQNYVKDLLISLESLQKRGEAQFQLCTTFREEACAYRQACYEYLQTIESSITSQLGPVLDTERITTQAGQWPHISRGCLIRQLSNAKFELLPDVWKTVLITYGKAMRSLQRAQRIYRTPITNTVAIIKEIVNVEPTSDSKLLEFSDWLLLEIDSDLAMRQTQREIAYEIITPKASGVLEMQMGEGKSSVIVPSVAAALADGTALVRVVVLKPLAQQMFKLLVRKLTGLLGRRVYYLPFSRSLKLSSSDAELISKIYRECMAENGILLVQPEHLLSFELMGVEKLYDDEQDVANKLVETQAFLDKHSRDILDESDEILSVKFELIYTIGTQTNMEFAPGRWMIIQQFMDQARSAVRLVQERYAEGIELIWDEYASFPRIRLLEKEAAEYFLNIIVERICSGRMSAIPVWSLDEDAKHAIREFISTYRTDSKFLTTLNQIFEDDANLQCSLLLARGLIAHGIIRFAFEEKRWRVNYGLAPERLPATNLAVPYTGKDCPSPRSEFSHPDVAILLTLLSHYYGGLNDKQLFRCLGSLLAMDNAEDEYRRWVEDTREAPNAEKEFPSQFQKLESVNEKNQTQCVELIFPHFKKSKVVVDFYLCQFVFGKEAKEFPSKLSTSGWNIAKEKSHPTMGFSGTKDSRYVLPLSIKQIDLPQHLHTNAAVLDFLLRPENRYENILSDGDDEFSAEFLLQEIGKMKPSVKVLIDVGAQILEMSNEEVARHWLFTVDSTAPAVVFFDSKDELLVLSRNGNKPEPLHISPFANQLDECLVYLDEIHTRGTDLRLPIDYRAAVTLGPRLTKDKLAQACMRMRNLGKGQSVVFVASRDVQKKILEASEKGSDSDIEVEDVLNWCIQESCLHTRKSVPLWAVQGDRFLRQAEARASYSGKELSHALREREAKTLVEWYDAPANRVAKGASESCLATRLSSYPEIRAKLEDFGIEETQEAALQEEQERELSPEEEKEVQNERPPAVDPQTHQLEKAVKEAAILGNVDLSSSSFVPAFASISNTSAGQHFEESAWPKDLLATRDFVRTVKPVSTEDKLDDFIRPVNWILTVQDRHSLKLHHIVISPFEANTLFPKIKITKAKVALHVYTPRTSRSMESFEDLDFCTLQSPSFADLRFSFSDFSVPHRLLLLFAGQVYFSSEEYYRSVCDFLGLASKELPGVSINTDGFVSRGERERYSDSVGNLTSSEFGKSPVPFLKGLVEMRRKGLAFDGTHLGKVLNGNLVGGKEFGKPCSAGSGGGEGSAGGDSE